MIQLWSPKPTNCSFREAKIEGRKEGRKEGGKEGKEGDFQIAENSSIRYVRYVRYLL